MKTIVLLTFLIFLTSCGNSIELKEDFTPSFRGIDQSRSITFQAISEQILEPNCISCHAGYTDYETIFAQRDKILSAVLQGRMPKNAPALNNELKGLLNAWVSSGAPLGGDVVQEPTRPLEATWESLSKKVFFPKCVQCHNPNGQASFLDLSTRQKIFENRIDLLNNFEDVANSYLIEVITDPLEPMPPVWSDIERLNEEEVLTIIEWAEKGLP